MDGALLAPAQLTKMNIVHLKPLRRIFKFKSSSYHRIFGSSTANCSNEYLAGLAFSLRKVPTPSQLHSQQRLQLLIPPPYNIRLLSWATTPTHMSPLTTGRDAHARIGLNHASLKQCSVLMYMASDSSFTCGHT